MKQFWLSVGTFEATGPKDMRGNTKELKLQTLLSYTALIGFTWGSAQHFFGRWRKEKR